MLVTLDSITGIIKSDDKQPNAAEEEKREKQIKVDKTLQASTQKLKFSNSMEDILN